jgi:membrane protein
MKRDDIWRLTRSALGRAGRDRVTTSAASLAFHEFLALVPGAVALVGVANLVGLPRARLQSLLHGIAALLPTAAAKVLQQALTSPQSRGTNVIAVAAGGAVALWAAIETAVALQIALDMAYETRASRGFFARRVRGLALVGVTLAFGGGAFVLLIVGGPLGSHILHVSGAFSPLWTALRWVVGVACVVLLISSYDYLGPDRVDRRWIMLTAGGAISAILWLGVAVGYSYYLDHFGRSSQTYGAFAGVVSLLIWLYLSAIVILLGAELNRELEDRPAPVPGRRGRARVGRTR